MTKAEAQLITTTLRNTTQIIGQVSIALEMHGSGKLELDAKTAAGYGLSLGKAIAAVETVKQAAYAELD